MTNQPLNLDEIEARAAGLYEYATGLDEAWQAEADRLTGTDVPAMAEEIRRLHARVTELETAPATVPAAYELATRAHLAEQLKQVIDRCAKRAGQVAVGDGRRDLIARGMGLLSALHLIETGSADNTEQDGEYAGYDEDADPDGGFPDEPIPYADPADYPAETLRARRGIRPAGEAGVSVLAELEQLRAALREIRHLHKDSPMGPCPQCIDADAAAAGGDGLVPYPCPTARLAGAKDCDPPHVRADRYAAAGNEMAASLVRDGFGDDEIADMLRTPPAARP